MVVFLVSCNLILFIKMVISADDKVVSGKYVVREDIDVELF